MPPPCFAVIMQIAWYRSQRVGTAEFGSLGVSESRDNQKVDEFLSYLRQKCPTQDYHIILGMVLRNLKLAECMVRDHFTVHVKPSEWQDKILGGNVYFQSILQRDGEGDVKVAHLFLIHKSKFWCVEMTGTRPNRIFASGNHKVINEASKD